MTPKQDAVTQNELHPEPAPTVKLDWELQHPAIDDGEDEADEALPFEPMGWDEADRVASELEAEGLADEDEADPEIVQDYLNGQFALMFMNAGGNEKRSRCKALRAVAAAWEGSRKEFVAAAVANGIMPGTASTQWQVAKTRED